MSEEIGWDDAGSDPREDILRGLEASSRPVQRPTFWFPVWVGERFGATLRHVGAELVQLNGAPYEPPAKTEAEIAEQLEAREGWVLETFRSKRIVICSPSDVAARFSDAALGLGCDHE